MRIQVLESFLSKPAIFVLLMCSLRTEDFLSESISYSNVIEPSKSHIHVPVHANIFSICK